MSRVRGPWVLNNVRAFVVVDYEAFRTRRPPRSAQVTGADCLALHASRANRYKLAAMFLAFERSEL